MIGVHHVASDADRVALRLRNTANRCLYTAMYCPRLVRRHVTKQSPGLECRQLVLLHRNVNILIVNLRMSS